MKFLILSVLTKLNLIIFLKSDIPAKEFMICTYIYIRFQMVGSMGQVFDYMLASPGGFELNRNIWSHVYPGKSHTFEAWLARSWSALKIFAIDRN